MGSFMRGDGTSSLNFAGFNQDAGCYAVGTNDGFRIYNCDPWKETFVRTFQSEHTGIGHVEMLFRCNILALVGGGKNPRYPPNKVILWDDHQGRCIGELTYFKSNILAVKLRRDRIVVVTQDRVYVYNFSDLKLLDIINTADNNRALIAVCAAADNNMIACLGKQVGTVQILDYNHPQKKSIIITAHETNIACLALSIDGTLLATASEKGTLIRVYSTRNGQQLHELRRGAERAEIYSIAFHPSNQWLVVSSDKGTVHVFKLDMNLSQQQTDDTKKKNNNPTSSLSFMSSLLPKYFSSEWSYAQFKVKECRNIVAFGQQDNSIIVVNTAGEFFKAVFDPRVAGQECVQDAYISFLDPRV